MEIEVAYGESYLIFPFGQKCDVCVVKGSGWSRCRTDDQCHEWKVGICLWTVRQGCNPRGAPVTMLNQDEQVGEPKTLIELYAGADFLRYAIRTSFTHVLKAS